MSDQQFRDLVRKMRAAQAHYFRHRDNLPACKQLEREVDDELSGKREPGLFDNHQEERCDERD
jgi:hypothetical protein